MELKALPQKLTVCKVTSCTDIPLDDELFFVGRTDEELSLVCETANVPTGAIEREDGWRAFRIQGVLDFSLVGILAKLTGVLARNGIGLFAISTFNTDYVLVKEERFSEALGLLADEGYTIAD